MGDLSKRLSRNEFACKCGCGFNQVDYELIRNLETCCDYFLQNRPDAKRVVIHINSGNRCAAYDRNLKIKQAREAGEVYRANPKKSEHLKGWAADFWLEYELEDGAREKIDDDEIANYLESAYVTKHGIGRYNGRTHYDTRTNGPARWDRR